MVRVGIDLGTTNTAVAMVYDDGPHIVPRGSGRIIPSAVVFGRDEGDVVVGERAVNAGAQAVRSVKRLMGRTYEEALAEGSAAFFPTEEGSVRLTRRGAHDIGVEVRAAPGAPTGAPVAVRGPDLPVAGARVLWPHEISAHVLAEAKRHAEAHVGGSVEALVTVPAYFRDPHRAATLDAARAAGLSVFGELLDEPTAAALAFAPRIGLRSGEPVLVVDWGGGTLDVTVITSDGAEWFQNAIDGDLVLGGDDVDHLVAEMALARAGLPPELLDEETNRWTLVNQARLVKETLSERDEAVLACPHLVDPDDGRRLPPLAVTLTRAELDDAMEPLLSRMAVIVERCLDKPNVDRLAIGKVLLVGGSSRIPAFRARLRSMLPRARQHDELDPMQAVALGAAMHAAVPPKISRISPYGYAVLDDEGSYTDVMPPDTETPTPDHLRAGVPAETRYVGQTVYRIRVASFREYRNGMRTYQTPRRLFARGMPATGVGTRVDVELWLDENKDLQGRSHVEGKPGEYPLQGRNEGLGELFGRLLDATLDGEALVEANAKASGGLIGPLRTAVTWALSVEKTGNRGQAAEVLYRLTDLGEQVEHHHRRVAMGGQSEEARARDTVGGWLALIEYDMIPKFWSVLADDTRQDTRKQIAALRNMLATDAPPGSLHAALTQLRETLVKGDLGPALRAYYEADLLGIPARLAEELRRHALLARDHELAGRKAALEKELEALQHLLAEAKASWRTWMETGSILEASPDLKIITRQEGTVH